MAAPATSKVFMADQMIGLLKEIDSNVKNIVQEAQRQGPRVQREVRVLLQKYLDLLGKVLGECKDLKHFTDTSQRSLKDIEQILALVVNGKVKEILEDINMEHYLPNFEGKDLINAFQLLKPTFDINQADLELSDEAKDAIQGQVKALRKDFSMIGKHLKEVEEKADKCHTSSKKITQDFDAFIKEIEKTQETMTSTAFKLSFSKIAVAIALLGIGVAGLVALVYGCEAFMLGGIAITTKVPAAAGIGGGVLAAGEAACDFHLRKEDMEKIRPALEKLEEQLNQMGLEAHKQKTAHKIDVQDQAKGIVDKINDLNADNLQLEPSSKGPEMKRLHQGVKSVRTEVEDLNKNVEKFQTEAKRTLDKLQDISLMSGSAAVVAKKTPGELILGYITDLLEAWAESKFARKCGEYLVEWLKGLGPHVKL